MPAGRSATRGHRSARTIEGGAALSDHAVQSAGGTSGWHGEELRRQELSGSQGLSPSAAGLAVTSIETPTSWLVAVAVLAVMSFAFGAPFISVVALKQIAAELGSAR